MLFSKAVFLTGGMRAHFRHKRSFPQIFCPPPRLGPDALGVLGLMNLRS